MSTIVGPDVEAELAEATELLKRRAREYSNAVGQARGVPRMSLHHAEVQLLIVAIEYATKEEAVERKRAQDAASVPHADV